MTAMFIFTLTGKSTFDLYTLNVSLWNYKRILQDVLAYTRQIPNSRR